MGLSGFSLDDLIFHGGEPRYETAHPTVPDSVLNYDGKVYQFYSTGGLSADFEENDCAPHPFDIMALFALYQNVPK